MNYNPYLNSRKLNRNLNLWTKHFVNCTIIDISYYNHNDNYVNNICNKLNVCIDYLEYKKQYLTQQSLRRHIKNAIFQSKSIERKPAKVPHKKGTIPYYFSRGPPQTQQQPKTRPNNIEISEQIKTFTETPSPIQPNKKIFFRSQK